MGELNGNQDTTESFKKASTIFWAKMSVDSTISKKGTLLCFKRGGRTVTQGLHYILQKIGRRLDLILTRGKVEKAQSENLQVELSTGGVLSKVELFQHYGFASRPPAGTEGMFLSTGTRKSLFCGWTRHALPPSLREKLEEGATVIFAKDKSHLLLTPEGKIQICVDGLDVLPTLIDLFEKVVSSPVSTPQGMGSLQIPQDFPSTLKELRQRCVG